MPTGVLWFLPLVDPKQIYLDQMQWFCQTGAIPCHPPGQEGINNITDWNNLKIVNWRIQEHWHLWQWGRPDLLHKYESVQEVAEDLSPKIKTLKANLEIIQQFHNVEDLQSITLTQHLVQNIINRIPMKVKSDLNKQYMKLRNRCAANVWPQQHLSTSISF